MRTSTEIKNELEQSEAARIEAKKAWGKLYEENETEAFNPNNKEYKTFCDIDEHIENLKDELRKAERYEVKEGDGVTVHLYSDAEAFTVIKRTAKTITIQRDTAILDENFKPEFVEGGFCGHCVNQDEQTYAYKRNPNGRKITARWSEKRGAFLYLDKIITNGRREFYDYNF